MEYICDSEPSVVLNNMPGSSVVCESPTTSSVGSSVYDPEQSVDPPAGRSDAEMQQSHVDLPSDEPTVSSSVLHKDPVRKSARVRKPVQKMDL